MFDGGLSPPFSKEHWVVLGLRKERGKDASIVLGVMLVVVIWLAGMAMVSVSSLQKPVTSNMYH